MQPRHQLLPWDPRREFALQVLDVGELDQLVEVFGVDVGASLGRHVVERTAARPRLELLEVKASHLAPEAHGTHESDEARRSYARTWLDAEVEPAELCFAIADANERTLAGFLDRELERLDLDHGIRRGVVPCSECGRWNYHLATCSRRGVR